MKIGMHLSSQKTFFKYFISYLLVLTVSLTGVYLLLNLQLRKEFSRVYQEKEDIKLENLSEQITDELMNLNRTSLTVSENLNLISARYKADAYSHYVAVKELKNYVAGNSLLKDIIYIDIKSGQALSAATYIKSTDTILEFGNNASSADGVDFYRIPYREIMESGCSNTILRFDMGAEALLLYIPPQSSGYYAIYYVLNQAELNALLKMGLSYGITSICLTNADGQILSAKEEEPFLPYQKEGRLSVAEGQSGGHALRRTGNGFSTIQLFALSDAQIINELISPVFQNAYLLVAVIALAGVILTFFLMRVTYLPLHELSQKVAREAPPGTGDLQRISQAFADVRKENEDLLRKVRNYRVIVQKSILGSLGGEGEQSPDITAEVDNFFNIGMENRFFVVCFFFKSPVNRSGFSEDLKRMLQIHTIFPLPEQQPNRLAYLFNHPGAPELTSEVLRELFEPITTKYDCQIALSGASTNPMDIARLYDAAALAAQYLGNEPLVTFETVREQAEGENNPPYPYHILDRFSQKLEEMDFKEARRELQRLFETIDLEESPDFFVRCILIDTVTLIISSINQTNLRFDKFSELYYETLYLCRSSDYTRNQQKILELMEGLLKTFEEETETAQVQIPQVKQYIKENSMSSSFSVMLLADHFRVSVAYMSTLFKKKTGTNLSDYIWKLRLEKAQGLLVESDYPIEKISAMVGYDNASSFRRKFKEVLGISPSQYRAQNRRPAAEPRD